MAAAAILTAVGFDAHARADEIISFSLSGEGISASGSITYAPDTIAGDPVGANNVLAISGLFSDSNVGISGATITGLIPTDPNTANSPYATSLSRIAVAGTLLPSDDKNSLTYDNVLYRGGAPDTCFDGITGGFVDVFGLLVTLNNGDLVNLWSNGGGPNVSPMYGVAVAEQIVIPDDAPTYTAIDYLGSGITMGVPEPASFWVLGSGLLGTLAFMRRYPRSRRSPPPCHREGRSDEAPSVT